MNLFLFIWVSILQLWNSQVWNSSGGCRLKSSWNLLFFSKHPELVTAPWVLLACWTLCLNNSLLLFLSNFSSLLEMRRNSASWRETLPTFLFLWNILSSGFSEDVLVYLYYRAWGIRSGTLKSSPGQRSSWWMSLGLWWKQGKSRDDLEASKAEIRTGVYVLGKARPEQW